ncbi:MAG: hypothetical protein RJQ09_04670 [Cyclobacteriaceae bacterium]
MNTTKILTYVFFVVALGLGYFLFNSISSKIAEEERIALMEARVIEKLKMIREAQIAFQAVNNRYTNSWDELTSFLDTGSFYITERTEVIIPLSYGADSIYVEIDTLGTILVQDSLFTRDKWPNFDLPTLMFIPGSDGKQFEMWADKIEKSGVMVDVVEVKNIAPVNPIRSEDSDRNDRKPLRFGSKTQVTTSGNWE